MTEGAEDGVVDPVTCPVCGVDRFELVKLYSNDTVLERTLRCVPKGHLRVDRATVPPAHAL